MLSSQLLEANDTFKFIRRLIAFPRLVCGSTLASEAFMAAAADIIAPQLVTDVNKNLVGLGAAAYLLLKRFKIRRLCLEELW